MSLWDGLALFIFPWGVHRRALLVTESGGMQQTCPSHLQRRRPLMLKITTFKKLFQSLLSVYVVWEILPSVKWGLSLIGDRFMTPNLFPLSCCSCACHACACLDKNFKSDIYPSLMQEWGAHQCLNPRWCLRQDVSQILTAHHPTYAATLELASCAQKRWMMVSRRTFVEVPWYSGVTARLSRWESGFDSRCHPVLLSFSKTLYPHCCSQPRCINGDPVGCERYCGWVGICAHVKWRLAGMLLREWKLCTVFSAELKLNPMTGVIIICACCDIVVLWIASLNACYYYYLLLLLLHAVLISTLCPFYKPKI